MQELTDKYVPMVTIQSKQSAPLFSNSIKKEISRMKRLFRKSMARNDKPTWQAYQSAVKNLSRTILAAKRNFFEITPTNMLTKYPQAVLEGRQPISPIKITVYDDKNDELTYSDTAVTLNKAFSSVFTTETDMNPSLSSYPVISEPCPRFHSRPVEFFT